MTRQVEREQTRLDQLRAQTWGVWLHEAEDGARSMVLPNETPLGLAELLRKRELDLAVKPPVGAFVLVCRLPVFLWVVLGPLRQVPVLFVFQFLPVLLVALLAIIGKRIFLDFRRPATGHANLVSGVGSAEMDRSSG